MARIVSNAEVFAYLGISTPTGEQSALMNILAPMAEDAVRQYVGYTIDSGTYTHFLPERNSHMGEVTSLDSVNNRVYFEYEGGDQSLYLPERPVRTITSVYEDQAAYGGQGASDFSNATLLVAGTDYFVDYTTSGVSWSGLIRKIAGTWPSRARTIKVVYTAGLSANELSGTTAVAGPDGMGVGTLKRSALISAAIAFKQSESVQGDSAGPIMSERLADYSVNYGKSVDSLLGHRFSLPEQVRDDLAPFRRYRVY